MIRKIAADVDRYQRNHITILNCGKILISTSFWLWYLFPLGNLQIAGREIHMRGDATWDQKQSMALSFEETIYVCKLARCTFPTKCEKQCRADENESNMKRELQELRIFPNFILYFWVTIIVSSCSQMSKFYNGKVMQNVQYQNMVKM